MQAKMFPITENCLKNRKKLKWLIQTYNAASSIFLSQCKNGSSTHNNAVNCIFKIQFLHRFSHDWFIIDLWMLILIHPATSTELSSLSLSPQVFYRQGNRWPSGSDRGSLKYPRCLCRPTVQPVNTDTPGVILLCLLMQDSRHELKWTRMPRVCVPGQRGGPENRLHHAEHPVHAHREQGDRHRCGADGEQAKRKCLH